MEEKLISIKTHNKYEDMRNIGDKKQVSFVKPVQMC